MKTKDRILEVALRQFNESGTGPATVRSIAEEVGISHGNLCYHYKNTDALIEALYDRLVEEVDEQVLREYGLENGLEVMVQQAEATFHLLYKYRFLLLDFVRIIRRIDSVREKFRVLIQLRRQQFRIGLNHLIAQGLMREEWEPGLYDHLITNMLIVGDNWIAHAEIHFDEKGEHVIAYYLQAFLGLLVPYFTDEGLREYRQVMVRRKKALA